MSLFRPTARAPHLPDTDSFFVASVSPIELPASSTIRRTPPRPVERRQPDYMEKFDDTHLFYDVFWDGARLVLIGPNLLNLKDIVTGASLFLDGTPLAGPVELRSGDLVDIAFAPAPERPRLLRFSASAVACEVNVRPPRFEVFRGRKVLCTVSKDNDLVWIRDWVEFHVKAHGADAVLFYDNASTRYGVRDVLATIRDVPGIAAAVVVPWTFRFGPTGLPNAVDWDSFYAQPVMLEHARRRFLQEAAAMVNADIDELIVADDGVSVFERVAAAPSGAILYLGRWIRNRRTGRIGGGKRHRYYLHRLENDKPYLTKWTAVPQRLPDGAQAGIHDFIGFEADVAPQINYRHFRAISTSWQYPRKGMEWRHRRRLKVDETWLRQMQAIGWAR